MTIGTWAEVALLVSTHGVHGTLAISIGKWINDMANDSGTPSTRQRETGSGLALAGTFTIEDLAPPLAYLLGRLGLDIDLLFAPYNQIFQQLLTPEALLSSISKGANVILLRLEDFVRDESETDKARQLVNEVVEALINAARTFSSRAKVPVIYMIFATARSPMDALYDSLIESTLRLSEALRGFTSTSIVHSIDADKLCNGERLDPMGDELGHIPYTEEYMSAIALVIARKVHSFLVPSHKVLVLDCDNTLWSGIVGEDGPFGISFPDALKEVHRFAVRVQALGVLVCLASKNIEPDVLEVFATRPEMLLNTDHVAAHRINWESKVSNLLSLAKELNLGLDSFVFIDDNPVECGQVRAELPEVITLQLPAPQRIYSFLENLWVFDRASLTDEDIRRTAMYRENAARQDLEKASGDVSKFIESLQMVIDIRPPAESEWARLSQLTQKTNQFNFTTKRRSEAELRALAKEGVQLLCVHVSDRFGDYGLVGLTIFSFGEYTVSVDSFILSCRVLGRGVEHSVMRRFAEEAKANELSSIDLLLSPTAKNKPALAFIESVAGNWRIQSSKEFLYKIPVSSALQIHHRPGHDPDAIINASRSDAKDIDRERGLSMQNRSERYETVALNLDSGAAVMNAVKAQCGKLRSLPQPPVPATSLTQRKLLKIWKDVLGLDDVGIEDEYSALGGTSLMAVRLFAAVSSEFGKILPVTTILTAPTVRALALLLDRDVPEASENLIQFRGGGTVSLYLVHEGNGEVLLYAHLARRLPATFSVIGVQPNVLPNVPLAHASVESMAEHYVNAILRRGNPGPIFLGGLCAGGVIAFEMARQLQRKGCRVERVFLLEAASPQASLRAGTPQQQRMRRIQAIWRDELRRRGTIAGTFTAVASFVRKALRAPHQRRQAKQEQASELRRFDLLNGVLRDGVPWPPEFPPFSAIEIYGRIESNYTPGRLAAVPVSLVHASTGEGNDRPLQVLFGDRALGWGAYTDQLEIVQVPGGHASMFQEQNAEHLARVLLDRMQPANLADQSHGGNLANP